MIEIMVVVSVLGVLGMGLYKTVKRVLYDYEAYSALDFCKKIEKAYINAYLVYSENIGAFGFNHVNYYFALGRLSWAREDLAKHTKNMFLPKKIEPFLPKKMVRRKCDFVDVLKDPYYEEYFTAGEKERLKNGEAIQLNFVRGIEMVWFSYYYVAVLFDTKFTSFFLKQKFGTGISRDGIIIATKSINCFPVQGTFW